MNVAAQTPLHTLWETVKMVAVALCIAFAIRTFIVQPYVIPSGSMLNTLQIGDRLFVTKFSYGIHLPFMQKAVISYAQPKHGDIIVFPFPGDKSVDYIKRVEGLPGDVIEVRDKQLYRNGQPVVESYVIHSDPGTMPGRRDFMPAVTVPEGKVFVMGDNRDSSEDSRFWGFADIDEIHGRAWLIYWSSTNFINIKWSRIGTLL